MMLQSGKEVLRLVCRFIIIFLMMIFVSGCGILSSDGKPSLNIETEQNTYDFNKEEFINVSIVNTSNQSIYYSTCLSRELEILDDGEIIDTIPYGVCYCLCPATLEPGDQVDSTISKTSVSTLLNGPGGFLQKESVIYRLKYSFYEDKSWGDKLLPENERRSNEFHIILPD